MTFLKCSSINLVTFALLTVTMPLAAQSNVSNGNSFLSYLINLSVEIKGNCNRDIIDVLQGDLHPCTFMDLDSYRKSDFIYLSTFDEKATRIKSYQIEVDREIIVKENIGKVKYLRFPTYSNFATGEVTVMSQLKNTLDNSISIHFQNFYPSSASDTKVFLPSNNSSSYKLNDVQPISNANGYQLITATRLLGGNLLLMIRFDYETLSNSLFKDIGSGGLGTISRAKEIKSVYTFVVFDKAGQTILRKATYFLPQQFFLRLAPNGGFALITQIQFRPEKIENATATSLKEFFNENKGMSVSVFDDKINVVKYLPIENKRDQRIKDPKLIGVVSDQNKLYVHYASNQSGILNQETFTMSEYSFADGNIQHFTSSSILDSDKYFTYDFGFVYGNELFLLHSLVGSNPMWDDRKFYRMKRNGDNLELSELKVPFIRLSPK